MNWSLLFFGLFLSLAPNVSFAQECDTASLLPGEQTTCEFPGCSLDYRRGVGINSHNRSQSGKFALGSDIQVLSVEERTSRKKRSSFSYEVTQPKQVSYSQDLSGEILDKSRELYAELAKKSEASGEDKAKLDADYASYLRQISVDQLLQVGTNAEVAFVCRGTASAGRKVWRSSKIYVTIERRITEDDAKLMLELLKTPGFFDQIQSFQDLFVKTFAQNVDETVETDDVEDGLN